VDGARDGDDGPHGPDRRALGQRPQGLPHAAPGGAQGQRGQAHHAQEGGRQPQDQLPQQAARQAAAVVPQGFCQFSLKKLVQPKHSTQVEFLGGIH